jgi:choline-glycine betaine transporter
MPNDRSAGIVLAVVIALAFTLVVLVLAVAVRSAVRRHRASTKGRVDPRLNPSPQRMADHRARRDGQRTLTTRERLAELQELRRRDAIGDEEYDRARARALGSRRAR